MNKLVSFLSILLLSTSAVASQHSLALGTGITKQQLFSTISFSSPTVHASYTYWINSYAGITVDVGRGTETKNSLQIVDKKYTNKITLMTSIGLTLKYPVTDRLDVLVAVGKTDYKSVWKVNGIKPSWGNSTDSDWSYHAGLSYKTSSKTYIALIASILYDKDKVGYGKETTDSLVFYVGYRF